MALRAAQIVLQPRHGDEVEDVAIESLEALVEKVRGLGSAEELKPLLAKIAHNRAVSRLRELYAAKRRAGQTESYEAKQEACGDLPEAIAPGTVGVYLKRGLAAMRRSWGPGGKEV